MQDEKFGHRSVESRKFYSPSVIRYFGPHEQAVTHIIRRSREGGNPYTQAADMIATAVYGYPPSRADELEFWRARALIFLDGNHSCCGRGRAIRAEGAQRACLRIVQGRLDQSGRPPRAKTERGRADLRQCSAFPDRP